MNTNKKSKKKTTKVKSSTKTFGFEANIDEI